MVLHCAVFVLAMLGRSLEDLAVIELLPLAVARSGESGEPLCTKAPRRSSGLNDMDSFENEMMIKKSKPRRSASIRFDYSPFFWHSSESGIIQEYREATDHCT